MSGLLVFLVSNTHLATRNLKFRTELEPEFGKDLFFGLHVNLGAKFQSKIELLDLTKRSGYFASRGKIVFFSVWVRLRARVGIRVRIRVRVWVRVWVRIRLRASLALAAK